MKVIVYSKLATFPQVDYAEGWGGNHNRKDNIVGINCSEIYTAGEYE